MVTNFFIYYSCFLLIPWIAGTHWCVLHVCGLITASANSPPLTGQWGQVFIVVCFLGKPTGQVLCRVADLACIVVYFLNSHGVDKGVQVKAFTKTQVPKNAFFKSALQKSKLEICTAQTEGKNTRLLLVMSWPMWMGTLLSMTMKLPAVLTLM